ncbi:MAG TPA: carboxypeptidase-like regulatory domain-containing protein [Vicinamibacterales bacterium]|nr:carboxypeptidase-like regulatory domain-containing protein [Vicinamibacterales bacterium]
MSAAFRTAAALLLFASAFASPIALLGQRGGGAAQPQGGPAGQRGGGGGRIGIGDFFGRGQLPTGTGLIRGIVMSDGGTPVRRAQVRATVSGMPAARVTSTDADGRFELRDLPAGRWTLMASKPGFVSQRYGQRRPFETVSPIELANGQKIDGANFALLRGGVINGRVLDDLGESVANVRVTVQRRQMIEGTRRLINVGVNDETDDTGAFRLYGLAPGEYYVSAVLRNNPIEQPGDNAGYAPTFYPGTGNVNEAQRVTVGAGEEVSIGFSLLPVRLVRVSGTVVSQSGEIGGGNVQLVSAFDGSEGPMTTLGGGIQADGSFFIANVPPGSYMLTARSGAGGRGRGGAAVARAGGEMEIGSLPVVVGDGDVTGVSIILTRGASIAGTVVTEGTSPITLSNLRVMTRQIRNTPGMGVAGSGVSATGSFQLSTLSGAVSLRVENLPSQWMVKSIVIGSTDVTDGGFELRGTEQITNARIVLTDRLSELNGNVTLRNQEVKDSSVIVFAEDAALWTFPTRYVRMLRADAQGHYTLRGMPPGTYLMAALDYLEEGEWQDPEFLERLRESASRATIREGETKTVNLQLQSR